MKKTILTVLFVFLSFFLLSCEKESFTISFFEDEGDEPKVVQVEGGEQVGIPNDPTKEGKVFVGWYTNLNNPAPFNFSAIINEDLNLYAKWEDQFDMHISGTKSFSAESLWVHREEDKTSNLAFYDNNIVVIDSTKTANYESKAISIDKFKELILSWNVRDLNAARISFKVSVGKNDVFTHEFVLGIWEKEQQQTFQSPSTSTVSSGGTSISNRDPNHDQIKISFSVIPNYDDGFKINNISVTTKKDDTPIFVNEHRLENIELNVPRINQMSIPNIGNVICSPTSTTMVLNYYGYNYDPVEIARRVKGTKYSIYGNWSFNVAVAGAHDDIYSRVEYINNYGKIFDYLQQGIPVVLSIKTNSVSELPGSPMAYPSGHLIVLIGFEYVNNAWHAVINDPAVYYNKDVRRLYPVDALMKVHRGYSYVISNEPLD